MLMRTLISDVVMMLFLCCGWYNLWFILKRHMLHAAWCIILRWCTLHHLCFMCVVVIHHSRYLMGCLHCLHRNPRDRYPDVAALIDDLQCYREQRQVSVHTYSLMQRLARWNQRHVMAVTAVLSALAGALVCLFLLG